MAIKMKPKLKRKRLPWFWHSFADDKFLGVIVMRSRTPLDGIQRAHALGINPGGQVLSCQMADAFDPPEEATNRCLTREEVRKYFSSLEPHNFKGEPA